MCHHWPILALNTQPGSRAANKRKGPLLLGTLAPTSSRWPEGGERPSLRNWLWAFLWSCLPPHTSYGAGLLPSRRPHSLLLPPLVPTAALPWAWPLEGHQTKLFLVVFINSVEVMFTPSFIQRIPKVGKAWIFKKSKKENITLYPTTQR